MLYKFVEYVSNINADVVYVLKDSPVVKTIDGELFHEATQNFKVANFVNLSTYKPTGKTIDKEF